MVRPAGFLMMIRMTLKLEKDHVGEETAVIPGMIWVGWFISSVFPLLSSQSVMLDVIHRFQKKHCHKGLSDKEDQSAYSENHNIIIAIRKLTQFQIRNSLWRLQKPNPPLFSLLSSMLDAHNMFRITAWGKKRYNETPFRALDASNVVATFW